MTRSLLYTNVLDDSAAFVAVPTSGTSVHVYQVGTTTHITDTLYAGSTGGTTKSNPLTTDADGFVFAWLTSPGTSVPGYVDLVWTLGSTTTRKTVRIDYAPAQVQFAASGTYNVKAYSATGDGATDDTTNIKAAVTAAKAAGGGTIYFPAGNYVISDQLFQFEDSSSGGYAFVGDGRGASTILIKPSLGSGINPIFGALGRGSNNSLRMSGFLLRDLTIKSATRQSVEVAPVDFWQAQYGLIQNCHFENLTGPIKFTMCFYSVIDSCSFVSCGYAVNGEPTILFLQNDEGGTVVGQTSFCGVVNCTFTDNDAEAMYWSQADRCWAIGNYMKTSNSNATSLMYMQDPTDCRIIGNTFINGKNDNLTIASVGNSGYNTIIGNSFSSANGNAVGTGYGINIQSASSAQSHTKFVIQNNSFGAEGANNAGTVNYPSGVLFIPDLEQISAQGKILARSTAGPGVVEEVGVSGGLSMSPGSGLITSTQISNDPIFDTKGDIPAATGPDSAVKLPAGTNYIDTLISDSGQSMGLKWSKHFLRVTADMTAIQSQTTLQDMTGLSFTPEANATYAFRARYIMKGSNTTMDVKFGFSVPAACTMIWWPTASGNVATGSSPTAVLSEGSTQAFGTDNLISAYDLEGVILNGANATTWKAQYAQNTSSAADLIVKKNCIIELWRIA